jgi:predicted N-acetyltransferase YhbS
VPVAIIGRLAVARHRERMGIGGGMLQDALRRIIQISEVVGCAAVIVHAIDDEAAAFYARFGFAAFPARSRTLFLPVQTLRAAIA